MRIGKCNIVGASVALLVGASLASTAWAAGSDVVHYPRTEAYKDTPTHAHGDIGVPAPRTRVFAHARWAEDAGRDDTPRPHF